MFAQPLFRLTTKKTVYITSRVLCCIFISHMASNGEGFNLWWCYFGNKRQPATTFVGNNCNCKYSQIAKTLVSTSVGHKSDRKVLCRCPIAVDRKVFVIWVGACGPHDQYKQTGLKLENYYFFTFTFSRPEVRKLLLFYVFTFSRPEVRKLLLFYVFTFSRPEVRKLSLFYVFTFSRPEVRKLFRIYVFTFSRPARPQ